MIERIRFENYGPFREADLRLGPLTVLVGPNASGKTTALLALHRLRRSKSIRLAQLAQGADQGALEVEAKDWGGRFSVDRHLGDDGTGRFKTYTRHLSLEPRHLRSASYVDSSDPRLSSNGYGLPTALAHLKLSDDSKYVAILERTRGIVPSFVGLRFAREAVTKNGNNVFGDQLIFDMKNAKGLSPDQVSDGTVLTLGLLTAAMTVEKDETILLIDEIERSLHPRALGELVTHLRRLTEETGIQILATSHSPYLLDALKPDEVRLTGFLEDGSATIRELSDHPEFDRWKDEMTPGEFWSTVGEDWIQ